MSDNVAPDVFFRGPLRALAAAPDTISTAKLWQALTPEQRREVIVSELTCRCGASHHQAQFDEFARVMKCRPVSLRKRPPEQVAADLEKRTLPGWVHQGFVLQLLSRCLQPVFADLAVGARELPTTEHVVELSPSIRLDCDRVADSARAIFAKHDPERTLILLLAMYLQEASLRHALGPVLADAAGASVEDVVARAAESVERIRVHDPLIDEDEYGLEENSPDQDEIGDGVDVPSTHAHDSTTHSLPMAATEHTPTTSVDEEREVLAQAEQIFARLEEQLSVAIAEVRERRLPDTCLLTQYLSDAAACVTPLESRLREWVSSLGQTPDEGPASISTMAAWIEMIHRVEQVRDNGQRVREATEIVEAALRVRSERGDDLQPVRHAAQSLAERLAGEGEIALAAAGELLTGSHPLDVLVRTVQAGASLDLMERREASRSLGSVFGLDVGLGIAYDTLSLALPEVEAPPADRPVDAGSDEAPHAETAEETSTAEAATGALAEEPNTTNDETRAADAELMDAIEMETERADQAAVAVEAQSEKQEPPRPGAPASPEPIQNEAPQPETLEPGFTEEEPVWSGDGLGVVEIARAFVEAEPAQRPFVARDLAVSLLGEGRRGLAYHVGSWADAQAASHAVPAWLLRTLALSPLVQHSLTEIAYVLRDDFSVFSEDLLETGEPVHNQAMAILIAAASVRPALLAPGTFAAAALDRVRYHLGSNMGALWSYCQEIASFSSRGVALDTALLKGVRGQAAWEQALADLKDRTEKWCGGAAWFKFKYAPATQVWRHWTEKGGPIQAMLEPVRANDTRMLDFVRAEIESLSDRTSLRKRVDHTDRQVVARRSGDDIDFKAYSQFAVRVREAVDLAREWISLQEEAPGQSTGFRQEQADHIRRALAKRHAAVRAELEQHLVDVQPTLLRTATTCMIRAVDDLENLFAGSQPLGSADIVPERVLNAPLLRVPQFDLADDWSLLDADAVRVVEAIARSLAEGDLPSWEEAFQHRVDLGDHVGSHLLLTRLASDPGADEPRLDEMRRARHRKLLEDRGVVRRLAEAAEKQVDQAVMFGVVGEGERETLMERVREVVQAVDESEAFHRLRRELSAVSEELQQRKQEMAEALQDEMLRAGIDAVHPDHARIAAVLARGDLLTAREYIHHVERGHPIQNEDEDESAFTAFFPSNARELESFLIPSPTQVVTWIRESKPFSVVDMTVVPEPQARQAGDTVAAWLKAHASRNSPVNETARIVFSFLGFNVLDVASTQMKGKGSRVWSDVCTEPVLDRGRCPVAYFGSMAAGGFTAERARYRVLWVWDQPSAEDLIGAVGDTAHDAPTIVFYFGRLGEDRRRSLARLSRKEKRTFLVLDDLLLLHLCGEPAARMPVFFQCALPFTYLEPYVTTASLVPPEVFYGREDDRNAIVDRHGSCFIYGGRQLGKTALLRDVERRFHNPEEGRVALYVDLKGEGIGINRTVQDIWPLLAETFKAINVIPSTVPSHANPEKILGEIRKWLTADSHRRILLLLDETDRFLEGDREFVLVARLKKEMEDTGRNFKVVFAGLHNVQRTTRLGNNPLAHLGEPRCIGPLFENQEWREARALIKEPLASIGYHFESDDLVVRILSQTNYYPSLLQLYCTQLLKHVNRPNVEVLDSRNGPPYLITSKHVEDAYQNQELWQRIRERFNWTLDLDPRYRLIALLIAHYSGGETPPQYRAGFSPGEIRHLAVRWWPKGFAEDNSEESFAALLDEMVGLGILRQTERGRYRMRTGNVALLLGTPEEIDSALVSLSSQEPPAGYEAQTFRRPFPGTTTRSPLTAQQESLLQKRENGVLIVFGSDAAGLDALPGALPEVMGADFLIPLRDITERSHFRRELEGLKGRAKDGVSLVVVEPTCLWTDTWINDASDKVNQFKSKQNFVRILFVADPERVWQMLGPGAQPLDKLIRERRLTTFSLRPWHEATLRAWLDDLRVPATLMEQYLQSIHRLTGAWPTLNYEMLATLSLNAPGRWQNEWDRFEETWGDGERVLARARRFGFDFPGPGAVTRLLTHGAASAEELAIGGEMPLETVERELRWLDLLSYARPAEDATWALDPVLVHLLAAAAEHERLLVEPTRA